jgi:hypothetical protein
MGVPLVTLPSLSLFLSPRLAPGMLPSLKVTEGKREREGEREESGLDRGSPPIYRVRHRDSFENMLYS